MEPKYSISIAVHNNLEFTRKCIESIFAAGEADFEVIVTDNASTDGTTDYLCELHRQKGVKYIRNQTNEGFISAHNHALSHACGQYLVILNNDAVVPAGWLSTLEGPFAKNTNVAIVGIRGTCSKLAPDGTGVGYDADEYVEASCMMIPVALARKHGLFDRVYRFGYFEDSDLSLRLREKGYTLAHVNMPGFVHYKAKTSAIVEKNGTDLEGYRLRNQKIFIGRWGKYLNRRSLACKTLIKRQAAIGDVLLTTPVIRELKTHNHLREIVVETMFPEIFRGNPHVARADRRPQRVQDFDDVFDLNLAYERDPMKHIVAAYAQACGILPPASFLSDIYPTEEETVWSQNVMPQGQVLAIHCGPTAWPGRNWMLDRFARVAEHFRVKSWKIVLVGQGATKFPGPIDADLRNKTVIQSLYACLKRANLFVGIDSLPMHLALAAGIPTVAVFGCIDPAYRLPEEPWARGVVAEKVGCRGCHHYLPAPRTESGCFRRSPICMEWLEAGQVIEAAEEVLQFRHASPQSIQLGG